MPTARGKSRISVSRSTTTDRTPYKPSRLPIVIPQGPAPTTMTSVSGSGPMGSGNQEPEAGLVERGRVLEMGPVPHMRHLEQLGVRHQGPPPPRRVLVLVVVLAGRHHERREPDRLPLPLG